MTYRNRVLSILRFDHNMKGFPKRLLITGVSGLLGNNIAYHLKNKYEIIGLYHQHPVQIQGVHTRKCNLTDPKAVKEIVDGVGPHIIVHCASLTNIDQCESDREMTKRVNVDATKHIVQAVGDKPVRLIYISTDAVYDGVKGHFSETDAINPQNYYGQSKYEGEQEIAKSERHLIFRTNIFGWNIQDKQSLGEWILAALKNGQAIHGFVDAIFSTMYTMELARIIDISIQRNLGGLYNCGSIDAYSKYHFSTEIAERFGYDRPNIKSISIEEFGFRAKRGKDLSLNVSKLQNAIDYAIPSLSYSLESFYRDFQCGLPQEIKREHTSRPVGNPLITYGRQWIDNRDIQAVCEVLTSDWITQGPKVQEFENALAGFCGSKYAVAANSGTSALHIACLAAVIDRNQEVITSPITFVASANCVVYCGGQPVFADVDPRTYTIDPLQLEKAINANTMGIIPVHFAGQSCDMKQIRDITKRAEKKYGHKIWIIEDASHALGSIYDETRIGSCAFSDMAVMSFHPVKHITTGEGGAVLTNDEALYRRLKRFRSHGITSVPEEFIYPEQAGNRGTPLQAETINPWYYEQIDLGLNYRITDIQCALGLSQIERLDQFVYRRREIVDIYNAAFQKFDSIQIPFEGENCISNFHLYVLLFNFKKIGITRAEFMKALKRNGIQTQVHYIPVHTQPYFQQNYNTRWGDFPRAEAYYQKCLSIPLYPSMSDSDVNKVIHEVIELVNRPNRPQIFHQTMAQ